MGKHSKRKVGYLPKVAAGAAPVALLFAAPATALAAQSDLTLPLDKLALPVDHQQDGTLGRDLTSATDGDASVVTGSLGLTRHDVFGKRVGDAQWVSDVKESVDSRHEARDTEIIDTSGLVKVVDEKEVEAVSHAEKHSLRPSEDVLARTANDQRLSRGGNRASALSLNPGAGTAGLLDRDERRFGGGESTRHGVWLPNGIDALTENSEQADTGLRRSVLLDGDTAGDGRFAGDLAGGLATRRSSGQAVDLGPYGAIGTTSEQHAVGQFSGALDTARNTQGALSGRLDDLVMTDFGQSHALGGNVGPVSGLLNTAQTGRTGLTASSDPAARSEGRLTDSISGDLGIDHVAALHGGTTTSVRGVLPEQPSGLVTQQQTVSAGLLDQAPTTTSWTITAPPLSINRD